MRQFVDDAIKFALEKVRADRVCGNFCRVEKGDLIAGKLEYELKRFKKKYLVAVGKAACPMAEHMVEIMEFDEGLVATNKPCKIKSSNIKVFNASHPLPNEESVRAAEYMLELAKNSEREDLFVFLISGGASSLIEKPKIELEKYREIVEYMLKNHFTIEEINLIRKALSRIKGGKILKLIDGEVVSFVISDVVGDDLSVIGSGLTYYDRFTQKDFVEVCQKLKGFDICKLDYDSLKKDEFLFKRVTNHIIASNRTACLALEEFFKSKGFGVLNLGSYLKGKVEWVSDILFDSFKKAIGGMFGVKPPFVVVFGGETTVAVEGDGRGGRCQHLALLMAKKLKEIEGDFIFVSFATDGRDGNSPYAGAFVDRDVIKRANDLGLNIELFLETFNSSEFFEKAGGVISSFDTMTNVADIGFFIYK